MHICRCSGWIFQGTAARLGCCEGGVGWASHALLIGITGKDGLELRVETLEGIYVLLVSHCPFRAIETYLVGLIAREAARE